MRWSRAYLSRMTWSPGSRERPRLGDLSGLATASWGTEWGWPSPVVVDTTASTMAEIEECARQGAPEGTVVVAEEQTSGRGRRGRTWESAPRAGLWWSLLLRPDAPPHDTGWLPLVVGVGVARALRDHAGVEAGLKWPNDVLISNPDGRSAPVKIAGVLAERLPDLSVVVGVGINVDHDVDELPPGAGSLRTLGLAMDRTHLLMATLTSVADAYQAWRRGDDMRPDYEHMSVTLGREVTVDLGSRTIAGRAVALGASGELIVQTAVGVQEVVSAGDVTTLRPAPG